MEKITQRLIFPELFGKPIHYQFDEPHSSSDGGALLLKAADQKLQLTAALAGCLVDGRQAAKVKHSLEDLLRQRIYGLASGYADANDAARLAHDPIFKLLLDRSPVAGPELSSQPTLSRFENSMGAKENYRLALALALSVIERQQKRLRGKVRCVTIDLDPTVRDQWGLPAPRLTYDWRRPNELARIEFLTGKLEQLAAAMGATRYWRSPMGAGAPGAHHEGGTRMGDNPKTSVVNRYGQSWDIPNLFIIGSSTFPTMSGFNPTLTIQALGYMSADAIVNRYKKNPGRLV